MSSKLIMSLIALLVALSVAVIALGAMMVHRIRLERRRSDARVAALAAALDDPAWESIWANSREPVEAPPSHSVSLTVPEEVHSSRLPAFAVAALVVLGACTLLVVGMNSGARSRPVAAARAPASIELVSMRHALDGRPAIRPGPPAPVVR